MSAILQIGPITLFGESISGISIPIGSTVLWTFLVEDQVTRVPIDLTVPGTNVSMFVSAIDIRGNPISPPVISRQATIAISPTNQCTVAWNPSDTVPSGNPLAVGSYFLDVWLTDPAGNRLQQFGGGFISLLPASGLPGTPVTPLPGQAPLGQGPNIANFATFSAFPAASTKPWLLAEADDTRVLYFSDSVEWKSVGVGAGGVIWTTGTPWSAVYAELVSLQGSATVIVVGDCLMPDFVFSVPAGQYDLTRTRFLGIGLYEPGPLITFQPGALIDSALRCNLVGQNIRFFCSDPICASGSLVNINLTSSSLRRTSDVVVFRNVFSDENSTVSLFNASSVIGPLTPVNPFFQLQATTVLALAALDGSLVDPGTFGGASGSEVFAEADGASISTSAYPTVVTSPVVLSVVPFGNSFFIPPVVTSNYSANPWDSVHCDSSGGSFVITLPSPGVLLGIRVRVTNQIPTTHVVTVSAPLMSGASSIAANPGDSFEFEWNPSTATWAVLSKIFPKAFRYTVSQPSNASDFLVSLPANMVQPDTNYAVFLNIATAGVLPSIAAPITNRTASQVRIVTSDDLPNGTIIEIGVSHL